MVAVGGDTDYRDSKNHYYRQDDDPMDDPNRHREHGRVMSLKHGERSPLRSDRGNVRGQPDSPKIHQSSGRYDTGILRERRAPRSRSHSPVMQAKSDARDGGSGTLVEKQNCRELRSKYAHRSPSPIDSRGHERSVLVEEMRGRLHERENSWIDSRFIQGPRERRELREEGSRKSYHRSGSPSPLSSRRSRKDEFSKQHGSHHRHDLEDVRRSYRRDQFLREGRSKIQPPSPGNALQLPRSHSRSPPRSSKYGGLAAIRHRSRSQSLNSRVESSSYQRSRGYHGHEGRPTGSQHSDERLSLQPERPRYADERSIAEVARDEQQERQRFFKQQNQGHRDSHDADLSRYGSGSSAIGQSGGRGRGGNHHAQKHFNDIRSGDTYHQELAPPQHPSPLPLSDQYRSASPPPQDHRRAPPPLQPLQQPRESYGRERREEFVPRGRPSKYSPPPSPALHGMFSQRPEGLSDRHEFDPEADIIGNRHDRRRHSRHDRNWDEKDRHSHYRDHRETRPSLSLTPSPVRHEHSIGTSGRKSSGPSSHRSFNRRNESDNGPEEIGVSKQSRQMKGENIEPQQIEMKNGGARMARDELFAGMDDLTVDYEEDDE